ncbi:MAG: glycerophosphodiester phosphodiesterase family protein [Acidobacteriota bacterium]
MRIIGHRGYSGIAPENTIASFRKAIEAGCGLIELDVQLSCDGVPFVIHDATLDRTTDGHGSVLEMPASELGMFSAGFAARFGDQFVDERIPSLESALDFLKNKAQVLVEIKGESVFEEREDLERAVVDLVQRKELLDDVAVISFEPLALYRVKRMKPRIKTGFLVRNDELGRALDRAADLAASVILYHKSQIDQMKVDMAHDRGLLCCIFNVDTTEELMKYLPLGLDGIGSNYPGEMIRYLATGV